MSGQKAFDAIADPVRREILRLLAARDECSVSQLAESIAGSGSIRSMRPEPRVMCSWRCTNCSRLRHRPPRAERRRLGVPGSRRIRSA